tara:strand:+ start:285 stop:788 length:504 start_codon:yes stop_codon:yes gene_type:complete
MRILIFLFSIFLLKNCTTVEVTKEIIKVGNSVKNTISEITKEEKPPETTEEINDNIQIIEEEKEIITIEQIEQKGIVKTQQQFVQTNFFGNSIDKINKKLGDPALTRQDGLVYVLRYDSLKCRLFFFFNNNEEIKKVEHFELRDTSGNLIDRKQLIKQCYKEFKLIK